MSVRDLDFYSLEHEKQLGKLLAEQIQRNAKFVNDSAILAYVDRVGQRLARNSDVRMPVMFQVIDSDAISASTLPGGYQYLTRGLLLQMQSEAELAGVLAHGLAHTALRSATKQATKEEVTQLAMIPAMIYVPDTWPAGSPRLTASGAPFMIPLTSIKDQRDEELAADYFGLQYVYVTGYDPEAYLTIIKRVWPQQLPDAFSTSPPLDKRIQAMRNEIARILPTRADAVVSTAEFADFIGRVQAWRAPALKSSEKH